MDNSVDTYPEALVTSLRNEIVESQKIRTRLLMWKIALIAGLGAVGFNAVTLGCIYYSPPPRTWMLALIPFVCVFVDTVCIHNDNRIMLIGAWLRLGLDSGSEKGRHIVSYEKSCSNRRVIAFGLESFAIRGTTYIVLLMLAVVTIMEKLPSMGLKSVDMGNRTAGVIFLSVMLGLMTTYYYGLKQYEYMERTDQTKTLKDLEYTDNTLSIPLQYGISLALKKCISEKWSKFNPFKKKKQLTTNS